MLQLDATDFPLPPDLKNLKGQLLRELEKGLLKALRPQRVLRGDEVDERCRINRTTRYRLMAQGKFPGSIKIGPNAVGWLEAEIDAWILERAAERDAA